MGERRQSRLQQRGDTIVSSPTTPQCVPSRASGLSVILRLLWASVLFPRDEWSVPPDTVLANFLAIRVRGLSVERGRSAILRLDLTHTQVPIAQLHEAERLSDAGRLSMHLLYRQS